MLWGVQKRMDSVGKTIGRKVLKSIIHVTNTLEEKCNKAIFLIRISEA